MEIYNLYVVYIWATLKLQKNLSQKSEQVVFKILGFCEILFGCSTERFH